MEGGIPEKDDCGAGSFTEAGHHVVCVVRNHSYTLSKIVLAFVIEFWQLSSRNVSIDFVAASPVERSSGIPACNCCVERHGIECLVSQGQFLVT